MSLETTISLLPSIEYYLTFNIYCKENNSLVLRSCKCIFCSHLSCFPIWTPISHHFKEGYISRREILNLNRKIFAFCAKSGVEVTGYGYLDMLEYFFYYFNVIYLQSVICKHTTCFVHLVRYTES